MHTKSNNVEITMGSLTYEIIKELFKSILQRYQEVLEELMRGSECIFHSFDAFYYNLNKVSLSKGGSYIDSPKMAKIQKGNNKSKK